MKQTEVVAQRRAGFDARRAELLAAGYSEHQRVISILQANIYALLTAGPLALLCLLLYFYRWGLSFSFNLTVSVLFFVLLLLSIVVHELLHGLGWGLCCKNGFSSIGFGFIREYLTPYCHCSEPLRFSAYLCGALLPLLVLGCGIFALAWLYGNGFLLVLALFNILAAGGDTTLFFLMLRHRQAIFLDHPQECGFAAFER